MKIPKSFKLLAHNVDITISDEQCLDREVFGLSYNNGNKIVLGTKVNIQDKIEDIPLSQQEHAFLHELTHQILTMMGETRLGNNEKFVDMFSGLLHQALETAKY